MSASNYLENKVLDHILGNTAYSAPATVYIALHTGDPGETGAASECTGTGYAREPVTNNTTNFPNASGGSKSTGADITFDTPGSGGWGTVNYFSIWDALSAGNCLFISSVLAIPKTINQNDVVKFSSGQLTVTAD